MLTPAVFPSTFYSILFETREQHLSQRYVEYAICFSLLRRSKDPQERIQADLALKNFGSDALSIHLAIARSSMEVGVGVLSYSSFELHLARVVHII